MPHSEAELLAEIESLYRERFPDFVAVAASIVGGRESAREVVQDAFAAVVRSRRDFRREAPLEAWVWRAVINAARKKKQRYAREARAHAAAIAGNGSFAAGGALGEAKRPDRLRHIQGDRHEGQLRQRRYAFRFWVSSRCNKTGG